MAADPETVKALARGWTGQSGRIGNPDGQLEGCGESRVSPESTGVPLGVGMGWTVRVDVGVLGQAYALHIFEPLGGLSGSLGPWGWIDCHGFSRGVPRAVPNAALQRLHALDLNQRRRLHLV